MVTHDEIAHIPPNTCRCDVGVLPSEAISFLLELSR